MRLPRDIFNRINKILYKLGYQICRQKSSYIRLTTYQNGEHHITIPNHYSIRLGTLSAIINDIAFLTLKNQEEIATEIFK